LKTKLEPKKLNILNELDDNTNEQIDVDKKNISYEIEKSELKA
jgi:hypothetical protein